MSHSQELGRAIRSWNSSRQGDGEPLTGELCCRWTRLWTYGGEAMLGMYHLELDSGVQHQVEQGAVVVPRRATVLQGEGWAGQRQARCVDCCMYRVACPPTGLYERQEVPRHTAPNHPSASRTGQIPERFFFFIVQYSFGGHWTAFAILAMFVFYCKVFFRKKIPERFFLLQCFLLEEDPWKVFFYC